MFNRFLFIILHIFPSLIISYPVSGRVYQSSDHSVLLIGDFHQKEGNPKEIEFKETAAPFIKRLVEDNNIDCVVECTESYLRKKSQHLEKCQSVDDIKKFISTMPLILHLGFLKQNILEDFIWKKFNFGQELQNYFQIKIIGAPCVLGDWRFELIKEIVAVGIAAMTIGASIVNKLYVNGSFKNILENTCDKYLSDKQTQQIFIKELIGILMNRIMDVDSELTVDYLLKELSFISDKLSQLIVTTSEKEKEMWINFSAKIDQVKMNISHLIEDFKNLPVEEQVNFYNFFPKSLNNNYFELHWFVLIYSSMLKNKSLKFCNPLEHDSWINILLYDLAEVGFMHAILESKKNKRNTVIVMGRDHCKAVSSYLVSLGYQKRIALNNRRISLNPIQLEVLISNFFSNTSA